MEVEMTGDRIVKHQGISLRVDWRPGAGKLVENLPTTAGIYAEIYWPERGVRIGETGLSVRGKIRHDIRWFESMKSRTAPVAQLCRTLPIAQAAKATGTRGFEFFLVSADPRLADKELRQDCERFLFAWVRQVEGLVDWNRQRSWR